MQNHLISLFEYTVYSASSRDVSDVIVCGDWFAQLVITEGVGCTQQEMANTCVCLCNIPQPLHVHGLINTSIYCRIMFEALHCASVPVGGGKCSEMFHPSTSSCSV